MQFRVWLENLRYEDLEPRLLSDRGVRDEVAQKLWLSIKTTQRVLGLPEGEAAFVAREFNRRHGDQQKAARATSAEMDARRAAEDRDEYLYHVTTKGNLARIRRSGLRPDMPAQMTNYADYSRGKVFLCEKGGVSYWKERVENHAFHNSGREGVAVVLRVPRGAVGDLTPDPVGTEDSRHPCYFTSQTIPARLLQVPPAGV